MGQKLRFDGLSLKDKSCIQFGFDGLRLKDKSCIQFGFDGLSLGLMG